MNQPSRREFLAAVTATAASLAFGKDRAVPNILLRSGWQTVNIGDVTHTPGVLELLRQLLPGAKVRLWPMNIGEGVAEMLQAGYPEVELIKGRFDSHGQPTTDELRAALETTDLLLHGSGPSVVAYRDLLAWRKLTDKPFGTYGVTTEHINDELKDLLQGAAFVFTRETKSLGYLAKAGVTTPPTGFAPDGTFAFSLRDDAKAAAFMAEHGLTAGEFIVAVPRLRFTPYHLFKKVTWSAEEIARKTAVNEKYGEQDHAKLREAIIAYVRTTGKKVVVCPEMSYQLDIMDPLVIDPLPDDVKPHVTRRQTFWLPDEAASLYDQAEAVLSFECHSPIIANAVLTPAFYLRQPTDTIKGQMYYDLGLADWTFEVDDATGAQIAARLLQVEADHEAAVVLAAKAHDQARRQHVETMQVVAQTLGL